MTGVTALTCARESCWEEPAEASGLVCSPLAGTGGCLAGHRVFSENPAKIAGTLGGPEHLLRPRESCRTSPSLLKAV